MLKRLKLTKFKCHLDLEIFFTNGMNAIKGQNEAGKSTLYEAIGYAFWGSRFLPLSLEDTTTWGESPSKTQVELDFVHQGVEFSIMRRKAGATLTGPGVTSNGHAEVTAFIDRLFRLDLKTAKTVLVASQDELRADLFKGGAVALIEELAEMAVLDETITRIQHQLPSGNTKSLELQAAALEERLVVPTRYDTTELERRQLSTIQRLDVLDKRKVAHESGRPALAEAEAQAQARIALANASQAAHDRAAADLATLKARPALAAVKLGDLDRLMDAQAEQAGAKRTMEVWDRWHSLNPWTVSSADKATFLQTLAATQTLTLKLKSEIRSLVQDKGRQEALAITQDTCSLCGKDLKDVPEVVIINVGIAAKVEAIALELSDTESELATAEASLAQYAASKVAGEQLDALILAHPDKFTVSPGSWPAAVIWKGESVQEPVDTTDYEKLIRAERDLRTKHHDALTAEERAASRQAVLQAEVDGYTPVDIGTAHEDIKAMNAYSEVLQDLISSIDTYKDSLRDINSSIQSADENFKYATEAYEERKGQHEKLVEAIKQYEFHNNIIKKLRELRPIIAKRLWSAILSVVSDYFSRVRGEPTVVTRSDDGFLVNGKSVLAYSGSTKDALAIAIRIALQKTFMPNLDFILMDEPAKGMTPTRETDLLGMLAVAGFNQTLLVTHSSLADTFAANMVQVQR
jgi:DNA repair exonuclease SbcCD ATPase subunit